MVVHFTSKLYHVSVEISVCNQYLLFCVFNLNNVKAYIWQFNKVFMKPFHNSFIINVKKPFTTNGKVTDNTLKKKLIL